MTPEETIHGVVQDTHKLDFSLLSPCLERFLKDAVKVKYISDLKAKLNQGKVFLGYLEVGF